MWEGSRVHTKVLRMIDLGSYRGDHPVHVLVDWVSDLSTCINFGGKGLVHVLVSKPKHRVPRSEMPAGKGLSSKMALFNS